MIQHSTDATQWSTVGTVSAAGNSSTIRKYSFTHTAPAIGVNHYRLMQLDIDGNYKLSAVRTVRYVTSAAGITILGNPVINGQLEILNSGVSKYSGVGRRMIMK